MADQKTIELLNGVLADATVFYYKLHNYHWNVTGAGFYTLHEVFEGLYNEWAGIIDEIAERVKGLGGDPVPTLAASLQTTSLTEETESNVAAETMVKRTIADIRTQVTRMQAAQSQATEVGDRTTENALDGFIDGSAKHIWMLSAYLGIQAE